MTELDKDPWVSWGGSVEPVLEDDQAWQRRMQLKRFRYLAGLGTAGLLFIVVRGALVGGFFPWADLINSIFLGGLIIVSFWRPERLNLLVWLGLVSFFANVADGFTHWGDAVIVPAHMLLPLLVLYGALLGNIRMSLASMIGVLGVYAYTWMNHRDLDRLELLILTNLCVATLITGAASLGVWRHQSRLIRKLDQQTKRLGAELETRLRIQAMVTHDIRNPLLTLLHATVLDDRQSIQSMAERISEIVKSATGLTSGSKIIPSSVAIKDIWSYIQQTFSVRLADKDQTINTLGDEHLSVQADLSVLCNSILGNFISNAIKFSPRGAAIEVIVECVDEFVRIAVYDQGPGLPPELFQAGSEGGAYTSKPGTDGEQGTGYGLRIAALCAARMNGRIEVCNHAKGAAFSILLPRA